MSTPPTPESTPNPLPPEGGPLPTIPSTREERQLAMFCHLGGAFFSIFVPLIIWMIKKDQSRFVDDQAKEALNFQITFLIAHFLAGLTCCLTYGTLNAAVVVAAIVFSIMATLAVQKGEVYRYPFAIRLIK
jgi:uncharacterized Tic20 family protein